VREALGLDRKMFGDRHGYVAEDLRLLGLMRRLKGDFVEAEQLYQQALAVNRSLYGEEHANIAIGLSAVGGARMLRGDTAGSIAPLRASYEMYGRLNGPRHRNTLILGYRLARALGATDPAAAERLFRDVTARLDTSAVGNGATRVDGALGLGRLLTAHGRAAEARPLLEHTLVVARAVPNIEAWRLAEAQLALGECLTALGDRATAEPLVTAARATLGPQRRVQPGLAAQADAALARLRKDN
jgi:tetratricopeptide (TPR) repeat protein